jgi:hypothetical protein
VYASHFERLEASVESDKSPDQRKIDEEAKKLGQKKIHEKESIDIRSKWMLLYQLGLR